MAHRSKNKDKKKLKKTQQAMSNLIKKKTKNKKPQSTIKKKIYCSMSKYELT